MRPCRLLAAGLGLASALLAGCGAPDQAEVLDWMTQQRAQTRPRVVAVPEPRSYTPQAYTGAAAADPFSAQRLALALRRDPDQGGAGAGGSNLIAPELARPREPLESHPLDTMTMVGSLVKDGQPVALVRIDRLLHRVARGSYLGQNYGKVVKVTETEIVLREIVQDAAGEWVERAATLQLQENAK